MKRILVTVDDDLYKELCKYPNKSGTLREAFRVYNSYMSTERLAGVIKSLGHTEKRMANIERAITKIANAGNVSIDQHSDWGA